MDNKEKYNSIPDDTEILCINCGCIVPKSQVGIKEMREDGKTCCCKYCSWIKRRKGIPTIKGFTTQEIETMGRFIFNNPSNCLNDLSDILHDKNINDLCVLYQALKTQKEIYVNIKCDVCGEIFKISPSVYLKQDHHFCSRECYNKFRNDHLKRGKDSPFYNRIIGTCSYCGKQIELIPSDLKTKNRYGENYNFCSRECYSNFRSLYYTGEKCPSTHREITDDLRNKMRMSSAKRKRSEERLNTLPQVIVNNLLDKNEINYTREYNIKYYSIDNYLNNSGLYIEVMGDYWHVNPMKYNLENKINSTQEKQLIKDKQKHSYIKNHFNREILYLWESDIKLHPDVCEALIKFYISQDGILQNYHSFNYSVVNNKLILNADIIIPYQNISANKYKEFLIA